MKPLLIISTGRCVWEDLEKVKPFDGFITMAVNYMILHWPWRLDFAVSWHYDLVPLLVQVRTHRKHRNKPVTYGSKEGQGIDYSGRFKSGGIVTSGMYAACVGLHLGYEKIVIAGVPFDDSGHFYDPPGDEFKTRFHYEKKEKTWLEVKEMAGDKIRVVSGNLIPCFGEFSKEWLGEENVND